MSVEQPTELVARVTAVVHRALRLPTVYVGPMKMGSTPGWDSMGHMNVVIGLEKEFGIRFPPFRFSELTDIPSIVRALQS